MKPFILLAGIFLLTVSADNCHKTKKDHAKQTPPADKTAIKDNGLYKGRLEIKAACKNYTIKVIEGNIDTSWIEASWRNAAGGKTYTNVFGLSSICSFPSKIREGEEFYFSIDPSPARNCAVCMVYYPTPPKKLSIKVIEN